MEIPAFATREMCRALADWEDWDVAEFALGAAIGLWGPSHPLFLHDKWVFWSNNPLGNALHEVLLRLADVGVLEHRDEPDDQFRWNPRWTGPQAWPDMPDGSGEGQAM